MSRKNKFMEFIKFNLLVLRDTLFYVIISVFPITLIMFKHQPITWYIVSGYMYGLVSSSVVALCNRHRRSDINISIQMIKLIMVLSTFAMILLNKSTDVVKLNMQTIIFFCMLFICLYYETYKNKIAKKK